MGFFLQEDCWVDLTGDEMLDKARAQSVLNIYFICSALNLHEMCKFKAIDILDKMIGLGWIRTPSWLNLIAVIAVNLAQKFFDDQDVACVDIEDYLRLTNLIATPKQFKLLEIKVLQAVDYDLNSVNVCHMYESITECGMVCGGSVKGKSSIIFGYYLIHVAMVFAEVRRFKPSLLAFAVVYASRKVYSVKPHTVRALTCFLHPPFF